nr:multidrug ABC transporter ATPase [Cryobacterium roopkundense]
MVAGVVGLSILCFIAMIAGTALGVGNNDGFSKGLWPVVITLPLFGLPLGFLLTIGLIVFVAIRRKRDSTANPS